MKHLWKAAVMFLGFTAIIYGTTEVWPAANFKNDVNTIKTKTKRDQA